MSFAPSISTLVPCPDKIHAKLSQAAVLHASVSYAHTKLPRSPSLQAPAAPLPYLIALAPHTVLAYAPPGQLFPDLLRVTHLHVIALASAQALVASVNDKLPSPCSLKRAGFSEQGEGSLSFTDATRA